MSIIDKAKSISYSLLGILAGNKGIKRHINGFLVRFSPRWSRYYEHNYEADNYGFLKENLGPGMHVIDVGAHLGLFSAISSQLVGAGGKVVCFEPTPGTFNILKETLRLNHCENVNAVQAAVSNKEGIATFYVSEIAGCNANSLVNSKSARAAQGYEVKLYTIDGVVNQYGLNCGLIKIDAEGAEYDVLLGGLNTFRAQKPKLILGLHPAAIKEKGDSLEQIWDLLSGAGYQVRYEGKSLGRDEFCRQELLFDVHCL
jgi:FkbM family methyltransferase